MHVRSGEVPVYKDENYQVPVVQSLRRLRRIIRYVDMSNVSSYRSAPISICPLFINLVQKFDINDGHIPPERFSVVFLINRRTSMKHQVALSLLILGILPFSRGETSTQEDRNLMNKRIPTASSILASSSAGQTVTGRSTPNGCCSWDYGNCKLSPFF